MAKLKGEPGTEWLTVRVRVLGRKGKCQKNKEPLDKIIYLRVPLPVRVTVVVFPLVLTV